MATISEALAVAIGHHQAGRLQAAEQIYRQILQADPNHAEAIHLLGLIAHQTGRGEVAIEYIGRAIRLNGNVAAFHNNLGVALYDQGKLDEAIACYRWALELKPSYPEACNNLGSALVDQGKLDEAIACCRRALELKPDYADARNSLGVALKNQGKLEEAVACYRQALELRPDYAEAHNNLGNALKNQGKLEEAIAHCRRAVAMRPDVAEAQNNLGMALRDYGAVEEAVACYRRALALKPDVSEAHNNLGVALNDQGKVEEAVACYRRALQLKPHDAEIHNNLGVALKNQGKLDEALASFLRALELKPDLAKARSNLLFTLQYCEGVTPAELAGVHREYNRQHAASLRGAFVEHENVRDGRGRLRLGFVSPDLGWHPVGHLLVRVLENLNQGPCETICYSDRIVKDELTHRFQAAATRWRDVAGMSDQRLAEQIREDRIDVLFDLAGHTACNRLLVFARKPAPIQITWLGYEGTTGLEAMDYLLADRYVAPEGSESHFSERVLRMPENYVCYDPAATAPAVGDLPALRQGHVTFGSFNNLAKINRGVLVVWARILGRLPESRLLLKYTGFSDEQVRRRILEPFSAAGVSSERVALLPFSLYPEYMATYNKVDIALDPFPFSGSATTCDALWMGVPVITCPGETFASRHGLSHLSGVGLTETIAQDLDEYVELAVALAADLPRLAMLRAGLRERMAASPLCDGKRFAGNLLALLREIWENLKAGR